LRPKSCYGIINETGKQFSEAGSGGRAAMEFGLSLVTINACGALGIGIGIVVLVYKIQRRNQSKRYVRRLRERLQVSI
jgi:hypothetical protein